MKRVLDGKAQWRLSGKLSKEGQGIWVRLFLRNIQSRHRGPDIFRGGLSSPRPAQMLILEGRLMQDGEGRVERASKFLGEQAACSEVLGHLS